MLVLGQMFRRVLMGVLMTIMMAVPASAQARMSRAERAVVKRINQLRADHGMRGVHGDRRLARAADVHSRDMLRAQFFAHTSSNGTSTYNRVHRYRHSNLIGETLAYQPVRGDTSPKAIVRMWIESPGHLAVLTDGRFRRIGVAKRRGMFHGERVTMWTADLASAH
jgi:uncharacterized protein YkwD